MSKLSKISFFTLEKLLTITKEKQIFKFKQNELHNKLCSDQMQVFSYFYGCLTIKFSKKRKYLSIIIDLYIKWQDYVTTIVKKLCLFLPKFKLLCSIIDDKTIPLYKWYLLH